MWSTHSLVEIHNTPYLGYVVYEHVLLVQNVLSYRLIVSFNFLKLIYF